MIPRVQQRMRCASQNKKLIISIFVLLALSATAVWDVTMIIKDYIYDNRMTLVKLEPINQTYPFLENDPIQICIDYDKTLFKELWNYENANKIAEQYFYQGDTEEEEMRHLEIIKKSLEIFNNDTTGNIVVVDFGKGNLIFDYPIAIVVLMDALRDMDLDIMKGATDDFYKVDKYQWTIFYPLLDDILENASSIERMQKAGLERQNSMIRNQREHLQKVSMPLQEFGHFFLCVYLPLLSSMSSNDERSLYPGGNYLVGSIENRWEDMQDKSYTIALTDANRNDILVFDSLTNTTTEHVITIKNTGVFDKSITTECSDEPPIYTNNEVKSCKNIYLNAFKEKCGCKPFTYRNFFSKATTADDDHQSFFYCTSKIYESCFDKLRDQVTCLPLCKTAKNQYTIKDQTSLSPNAGFLYQMSRTMEPIYASSRLEFVCQETFYVIYEERFQLSQSQLLSQVGGDLGLYTGMSFLGLWQFLAFTYTLYKSSRKPKVNPSNLSPNETTAEPGRNALSILLVRYFDDSIDRSPNGNDNRQSTSIMAKDNSQAIARINQLEERQISTVQAVEQIKMQTNEIEKRQILAAAEMEQIKKQVNEMYELIKSTRDKQFYKQNNQEEEMTVTYL